MKEMAEKRTLELDPSPGLMVQGYSDAIAKTPPEIVKRAVAAFQ
jgi:hypothetical protein